MGLKTPLYIVASMLSISIALADSEQEFLWVEQGKDSVRAKIIDPDSAQFRGTFFNRNRDGIPFACGEVNAKNAMGGMTGYQKFVSAGNPDRTWLEEEVADFHNVWSRACQS